MDFDYDRFLVDQLVRPVANLYRVTPLAVGETPAGPPIAFVRQKKLAIKEDIRFFADEAQTDELFRVKARSLLDMGGSRYDILVEDEPIGVIRHKFRRVALPLDVAHRGSGRTGGRRSRGNAPLRSGSFVASSTSSRTSASSSRSRTTSRS